MSKQKKLKVNIKHYLIPSSKKNLKSEKYGVYVRVTAKRQTTNFKSPIFYDYPDELTSKESFLLKEGSEFVKEESHNIQKFLETIEFHANKGFSIKGLGKVYHERFFFHTILLFDDYFKSELKNNLDKSGFEIVSKLINWNPHISHIENDLKSLADAFDSKSLKRILKEKDKRENELWSSLENEEVVKFNSVEGRKVFDFDENPHFKKFYSFYEDSRVKKYLSGSDFETGILRRIIRWNFASAVQELTDQEYLKQNQYEYKNHLSSVLEKINCL